MCVCVYACVYFCVHAFCTIYILHATNKCALAVKHMLHYLCVVVTMWSKANVVCSFVSFQWEFFTLSFVYHRGLQMRRSLHISWKAQAPWELGLLLSPGLSKLFITGILTGFRLEKQRMKRRLSPLRSAAWMTEMEVGRVTVGPTGGRGVGDDGLDLIAPPPLPRWGRHTSALNGQRLPECWLSETETTRDRAQMLCLHPKWTLFDGYNELENLPVLDLSVWIIV